jgi:hypothetical protein
MLEKLVRAGRLASVKVGARRFVPHAAVVAYVESLEAA